MRVLQMAVRDLNVVALPTRGWTRYGRSRFGFQVITAHSIHVRQASQSEGQPPGPRAIGDDHHSCFHAASPFRHSNSSPKLR